MTKVLTIKSALAKETINKFRKTVKMTNKLPKAAKTTHVAKNRPNKTFVHILLFSDVEKIVYDKEKSMNN
uniref:Uncharacterized protein n=1 Tax=Romanomermis culicivorax TaxID=13658 RepID=A0A915KSH5_ROMCU